MCENLMRSFLKTSVTITLLIATLVFIDLSLFIPQSLAAPTDLALVECPPQQSDRLTQTEVAQLFDRWNAALQTGKPEEVTKNYTKDAILLPTLSNRVRHNPAEITNYFELFTSLKPVGKIEERNIRIYDGIATDSGIYSFAFVKDGQPRKVSARYSFVYRKEGDRWLISQHHSSAMPEK
jgi:uncharacterized protein (TIGR02246 family)